MNGVSITSLIQKMNLELLTRALQGLSDDLRRAAAQQEEVDR